MFAAESKAHRIPHTGVSDRMALDQKLQNLIKIIWVRRERRRKMLLMPSER